MKKVVSICCFFLLLLACKGTNWQQANLKEPTPVRKDLDSIVKTGKLKALVINNGSSYYLYEGLPMGFEYGLLKKLANHLSLELELSVVDNLDSVFTKLHKGEVDIIANGFIVNDVLKKQVGFTDFIYDEQQVLVQKKPDNWQGMPKKAWQDSLIKDRKEIVGKTISLSHKDVFLNQVPFLETEIGGTIAIDTLKESLSTSELIEKVANGKLKYTVANHRLAERIASYNAALAVNVTLTAKQAVAWAVRPNTPKLVSAVNKWIADEKKQQENAVVFDKYTTVTGKRAKKIKKDFYDLENNQISEFDYIIKLGAKKIGWDWRLLAAQIYQESQFKPKAKSWAGAGGLMQIMPKTASELGVKNRNNPIESIIGGTSYLQQIYDDFQDIKDPVQRIKFTMASYNCGYAHVRDAQKLAQHKGFNRNKWDYNVEIMILSLSFPQNHKKDFIKYGYVRGRETYNYVQRIFKRYEHYKEHITL